MQSHWRIAARTASSSSFSAATAMSSRLFLQRRMARLLLHTEPRPSCGRSIPSCIHKYPSHFFESRRLLATTSRSESRLFQTRRNGPTGSLQLQQQQQRPNEDAVHPNFRRRQQRQNHLSTSSSVRLEDDEEEEEDLEFLEHMERWSNASMAQLVPDEIFYKDHGPNKKGASKSRYWHPVSEKLNDELGEDSIWDAHLSNEGQDMEDEMEYEGEEHSVVSELEYKDGSLHHPQHQQQQQSSSLNHQDKIDDSSRLNKQSIHESAMKILKYFDPNTPPKTDDLEHLQIWLECHAQQEAVSKFQKFLDDARNRNAFDTMGFMLRQIVKWYKPLRDAIDHRQQTFLADRKGEEQQEYARGKTRYGPILCSLSPEKMSIIVATAAVTHCLLRSQRKGVTIVSLAMAIAKAVEMEKESQRLMQQKFAMERSTSKKLQEEQGAEDEEEEEDSVDLFATKGSSETPAVGTTLNGEMNTSTSPTTAAIDPEQLAKLGIQRPRDFSAAHLKRFLENLEHRDPKFTKTKRNIEIAIRRMNRDEEWTKSEKVHLGVALLAMLIETATITEEGGMEVPAFKVQKKWSNGNVYTYIILNETVAKRCLDDKITSVAPTTTRHTPMIVPPTDWEGPNQGGYRWLKTDIMRFHRSNLQGEALAQADLTSLCDGLNTLGKTEWKINKKMLDVAKKCWNNNISIGDIPSRDDHDVPPEPTRPKRIDPEAYAEMESSEHEETTAAYRAYREALSKTLRMKQKNMDLRSLRCSAMLKLNQAEKFKDFEKIYFPYNVDFRGRAYPIPPHLSTVGSDLCRGVLTFARSKPLGKRGLYWLKVHLANLAGKDKMSFDERCEFIDKNLENLRESVKDPFAGDNPWWMTLEDPFQGLATCHEIVNAIDSGDPESYECSLPVHMDGSCNGLQHYAALGRDTVGGKAVNLLEGDRPEDVYVGVMNEVIRRVAEEAERTLEFENQDADSLSRDQKLELKDNKAAKLVNGLIDRGVVKRTVMTSVYGVKFVGARTQIQEKLEEKLEEAGHNIDELDLEIFQASSYLARLTIEVMGDLFQGARKTMKWLADCARLIAWVGHPVAWISPIGIPVVQPYRQKRTSTILTVMQSVNIVDYPDDMPINKSKQVTAFPPNYVHSLDSSHMILTALEMDRRGLEFSAVHDSFWTHACDVDEMNEALRDCFVQLYSKPLLEDLRESWLLRYPGIEFPELPELGELDLEEVKSATYFFQ